MERNKLKKKKVVVVDTDSDNDRLDSAQCVDSDGNDIDVMMTQLADSDNICSICVGMNDYMYFDWVRCDCGQWFHVGCLCEMDSSLQGMTIQEISTMTYVCDACK